MTDVLYALASPSNPFVLQQATSIRMDCGVIAPVSTINIDVIVTVSRMDCVSTTPIRRMGCGATVPRS